MIYALILVISVLLALSVGYMFGRYQSKLLDKIRTLEANQKAEKPEAPTVIKGAYEPPKEISTSPDARAAGLVESKTPQRIQWEADEELRKEGLHGVRG